MRSFVLGSIVAIFTFYCCTVAAATEGASARDIDRLVFEGVDSIPTHVVKNVLRCDFEIVQAAHPDAAQSTFLRAVETTLLLAYRHSGFRDAQVTAQYDEQQQRIVIRVIEGPRHWCGGVTFAGAEPALAAAIQKSVTQSEKDEKAPWRDDRPAPFDDLTAREIRSRVSAAFASHGFLFPSFGATVTAPAGD